MGWVIKQLFHACLWYSQTITPCMGVDTGAAGAAFAAPIISAGAACRTIKNCMSLKCSSRSIKNKTILSKCLENIALQNQRIKYQKNVSKKKRNYCLKSSQNVRNRNVCSKIFPAEHASGPP